VELEVVLLFSIILSGSEILSRPLLLSQFLERKSPAGYLCMFPLGIWRFRYLFVRFKVCSSRSKFVKAGAVF
jgi:hypothetical protein